MIREDESGLFLLVSVLTFYVTCSKMMKLPLSSGSGTAKKIGVSKYIPCPLRAGLGMGLVPRDTKVLTSIFIPFKLSDADHYDFSLSSALRIMSDRFLFSAA